MNQPFFSVIMTTHNRAELLTQALESLARQTFSSYEALIIDDGSTDDTARVFDLFRSRPGWHFVANKENRGYPRCKNQAFGLMKGSWVTFLDSDDLWLSDRLARFHEHTQSHPDDGFVFSNGYVHQDGRTISLMAPRDARIPSGRLPAYMAVSNRWLPYVTTNVAISSDAVRAAGMYHEDMIYLGDTEYFARVIKNVPVGYIPEPLSVYRIHRVSLTQSWDRCIDESFAVLNEYRPPESDYRSLSDFINLSQALVCVKNGAGKKAREFLNRLYRQTTRSLLIRAASLMPAPFLRACQASYKKVRIFYLRYFGSRHYHEIDRWMKKIENNRGA